MSRSKLSSNSRVRKSTGHRLGSARSKCPYSSKNVGQPGQMVSGLEMMLGQIFLVTLVAGLVSLWRPGDALRRQRTRRDGDAPAPEGPSAG